MNSPVKYNGKTSPQLKELTKAVPIERKMPSAGPSSSPMPGSGEVTEPWGERAPSSVQVHTADTEKMLGRTSKKQTYGDK